MKVEQLLNKAIKDMQDQISFRDKYVDWNCSYDMKAIKQKLNTLKSLWLHFERQHPDFVKLEQQDLENKQIQKGIKLKQILRKYTQ